MQKFVVLILVLVLAGCTATFQPPAVCEDGDSVILKVTEGNPSGLDRALLTVNFVGLDRGAYTAAEVNEVLDEIAQEVNDGITYLDLLEHLVDKVEDIQRYAGASIIILGPQVQTMGNDGGDSMISACDTALILAHIKNQKQIVGLY